MIKKLKHKLRYMVTTEQLEAMKPSKYNGLWRGFITKRDLNIIGKWLEDPREEYENAKEAKVG